MNKEFKELLEIREIRASIEKINKKYRESKGYGEVSTNPSKNEMEDMMYQMMSNIYRYVDSLASNTYDWQDRHMSNSTHLPKLTPSQTEKLLKSCGAGDDYDVQKPVIWARSSRTGPKFEVDLKVKSKNLCNNK